MGKDWNRRIAGWLKRMLPALKLEKTGDGRRRQGRRWELKTLLTASLVGLLAGCRALAQVEELTEDLSGAVRKLLGIPRRVADTTLRNALVKLCPMELRHRLRDLIREAQRMKALVTVGLPYGVLAMDGKTTALPTWDDRYASQTEQSGCAYGLLRTITCVLVSAMGRPCIDAIPLLDGENEVGAFQACFESVLRNFGHLFQLVTYDAGGTSEENARAVVTAAKDYLFRVKNEAFFMTQAAMRWLAHLPVSEALATTTDILSKEAEEYVIRSVFLCKARGYHVWEHASTFVRVQSRKLVKGVVVHEENRFYASSAAQDVFTPQQWLALVRNHWGVETCHNVFDTIFNEDDRPWIEMDPRGTLAVLLLRRIAYTLLTLFKHRTLWREDGPAMRWRRLMTRLYNSLISSTDDQLAGLRDRAVTVAS